MMKDKDDMLTWMKGQLSHMEATAADLEEHYDAVSNVNRLACDYMADAQGYMDVAIEALEHAIVVLETAGPHQFPVD